MSEYVNTFALHYQSVYRERAQDSRFPLLWRLESLVKGSHQRNGHASFGRGEVAGILGVTPQQVSNLISEAKGLGLLDLQSTSRCLIVPSHAVTQGPGVATAPCGYCEGKRVGRRKPQNRRYAIVQTIPSGTSERLAQRNPAMISAPSRERPEQLQGNPIGSALVGV